MSILNMKYVVLDNGLNDIPLIFPGLESHANIAMHFNWPIVSAGFVKVNDNKVICYGKSVSLNANCRPDEDARLITKFLMPE